MLGEHDGVDLAHGAFHRVVDDEIIIGISGLKLDLCAHEAFLHLFGTVGATARQAFFKRLPRRRRDEDAHDIRPLMHNLQGTLYLDIEDDVLPLLHGLVDKLFRRAVEVADILGILQKGVLRDHFAELVDVGKVIVDAVYLAGTRRTRRGGNGEIKIVAILK